MGRQKTMRRVEDSGQRHDQFAELGADPAGGNLALVAHGPYAEALPVAGMSTAQVRRRFENLLDIHPQASAVLDGVPVDEHTLVQAGQILMFVRRAGEMGAGHDAAAGVQRGGAVPIADPDPRDNPTECFGLRNAPAC